MKPNTAPVTQGPRYTISGDFHYCVIEAESSSIDEPFRIAACYPDSPGAEPGQEWREKWEDVLWLIPPDNGYIDPLTFCLRKLNNWYNQEPICETCGSADCDGRGCYPEAEPIKAKPAEILITKTADGQSCLSCWNPITYCTECGEHSHCACGCRNVKCDASRDYGY